MKKITRIALVSLLAAAMTAAVTGCNKMNNEESSKASSTASDSASSEVSTASVTSAAESSSADNSGESSSSDTESSEESTDNTESLENTESTESSESTESTESSSAESSSAESSAAEESSGDQITDTVTQDDAQKILLKFLNADGEDSNLNARYTETVTVNVDNTGKYFMEFDVRLNNGITNSHIDYYYVACSRTDGGVYDSEAFEATYSYKRDDSDESSEESEESAESAESAESTESAEGSDDYSLPSDEITEEEAKDLLLGYLGGDNLIAVSKGKTTVDNNGEAVEYYIFDISSGDENSSSHIDDYYIINSRFGGGIYDSMTFKSRFKTAA